jgi:GAF domain-containing protein
MSMNEIRTDEPEPNFLAEALRDVHQTARDQVSAAWQLHIDRIQDQLASGWRDHIEKVFDDRFTELQERLERQFDGAVESRLSAELGPAISEASKQSREAALQPLARAVARFRIFETEEQWCNTLLDSAQNYANRAALFSAGNQSLRLLGERNVLGANGSGTFQGSIPVGSAPAFAKALESIETVIANCTAEELSQQGVDCLGEDSERQSVLLPVHTRSRVIGILYLDNGDAGGPFDIEALELLGSIAALAIEGFLGAVPSKASSGVPTSVGGTSRAMISAPSWSALTKEEQDLHLRAQRFARVLVAEMRLYQSQEVKKGRTDHALYRTLQKQIDEGRAAFRGQFLETSPTMVDYLHLEIVRTLANDDLALMGDEYPGAMV